MRVLLGGSDCALAGARAVLGAFAPRDAVFAPVCGDGGGDGGGDGVVSGVARGAVAWMRAAGADADACAFVAIHASSEDVGGGDDPSAAMAMDVVSYIARVLASGGGEGEVCVAAATRDEALTDGEAYEDATGGAEASAVETGIVRREMSASNGGGGLVLGDTTLAKVVRALAACGVKMRVLYARGYASRDEEDALAVTDRLCRAIETSAFGVAAKLKYDAPRMRALKVASRARGGDDLSELYM